MEEQNSDALIDNVADLVINATRLVVFTGAGISTESGLPDFRSPGGIWDRFDPDDFTYQKFISDPKARRKQWLMFKEEGLISEAKPNLVHYAIAELNKLGKLDYVITQNVDGLHQKVGVPNDKVFELHGNMQWVVCLGCGRRYPLAQIKDRLNAGEETPNCEVCHDILKPSAVLFGEALPAEMLEEAAYRSQSCDLFIVIGSTLIVYPAAYIPEFAIKRGTKLVIINLSSTPINQEAVVLIRAKAGDTMLKIVERVKEKMII